MIESLDPLRIAVTACIVFGAFVSQESFSKLMALLLLIAGVSLLAK